MAHKARMKVETWHGVANMATMARFIRSLGCTNPLGHDDPSHRPTNSHPNSGDPLGFAFIPLYVRHMLYHMAMRRVWKREYVTSGKVSDT